VDEELIIHLPDPHPKQQEFIRSPAKRKIVRAGRRGGKTVGAADLAVETFLAGGRILYAVPVTEQLNRFWTTVVRALEEPIKKKYFGKMRQSTLLNFRAQSNALKLRVPGMPIPFGEITEIS